MNVFLIIIGIVVIIGSVIIDYDRIPGSYTKYWSTEEKIAVRWLHRIIGAVFIIIGIYC
jgi:uncharacterized membrane protein